MKTMSKLIVLTAVAGSVAPALAQNVLQNPGFEGRCSGPAADWTPFGPSNERSFFARTGTTAIKQFGSWCAPLCYGTGIFQDVAVDASKKYKASAWITNPCWDAFSPTGQGGIVNIEYFDAADTLLTPFLAFGPGPWKSNRIDSPTTGGAPCFAEVAPVQVETAFEFPPAGAVKARIVLRMEQQDFGGGAGWWDDASFVEETNPGTELMTNTSFEDAVPGCGGSGAQYWTNFGNGQLNLGENARTGDFAAKLFGGFCCGSPSVSGWYSNAPATEGQQFQLSAWGRTSTADFLQAGNIVNLSIEFYDEFGTNLIGAAAVSPDLVGGPGAPTDYTFFETGIATAPAGTTSVRAVILQFQTQNPDGSYPGGATWWDDMNLNLVGCPCAADFDLSGGTPDSGDIDAFFTAWLLGESNADADCSGGTPDAGDIDVFFSQWLAGGC